MLDIRPGRLTIEARMGRCSSWYQLLRLSFVALQSLDWAFLLKSVIAWKHKWIDLEAFPFLPGTRSASRFGLFVDALLDVYAFDLSQEVVSSHFWTGIFSLSFSPSP